MKKKTGMILWEGFSQYDPEIPIMAVLTYGSNNEKTGNMPQIWILRSDIRPHLANKGLKGGTKAICGDCPHQHEKQGGCYVIVHNAPRAVYDCHTTGSGYDGYDSELMIKRIGGRRLRFGAYGDPAAIDPVKLNDLFNLFRQNDVEWTGYTHNWKNRPDLKGTLMASVDDETDRLIATAQGWRYFALSTVALDGAIECLAESHNKTCLECGLCDGTRSGKRAKVKSIFITPHGAKINKTLHIGE